MPTTIFISYASDDPDWPAEQVLKLATALRDKGAEVLLDRWEVEARGRRLSDGEWRAWMRSGLDRATHVLCLGSARYVELWHHSRDGPRGRGIAFESFALAQQLYDSKQMNDGRIWLYRAADAPEPADLKGRCPVYLAPGDESELIGHLSGSAPSTAQGAWARRLRAMLDDERTALYVPLSGQQRARAPNPVLLPQSTSKRVSEHLRRFMPAQETEYEDILDAVTPSTRALVLGEPGAGKTFALLKVLERDLDEGRAPIWVKLNHWLDGDLTFEAFVAREASDLGPSWVDIATSGYGHLLLDGLNELPLEHAASQRERIVAWLSEHPKCPVLLACREEDLPAGEFDWIEERLVVRPLRGRQIRQFVDNYYDSVDATASTALFWQLMGGEALRELWTDKPASVDDNRLDDFVAGVPDGAPWLPEARRSVWTVACDDPSRPYPLATNPYLLLMILSVWVLDRGTPVRQRVDLFEAFTSARLADEIEKRHDPADEADVQNWLATLAARLQRVAERAKEQRDAAIVSIAWRDLADTERGMVSLAMGAGVLRREGSQLRFRHQLLQEFYVARYLHDALIKGESSLLDATWGPDSPLWERSGWKQPFLLLAEYQHTAIPDLARALVRVQPEVAAVVWEQTRTRAPAVLSDELAEELSAALLTNMLPAKPSPDFPKREAAFGRAIAQMRRLDGSPMDRRRGVWGWHDSASNHTVVDIDWVTISAGPFIYQGNAEELNAFQISRYPVTVSQFRAFVDASDGYAQDRWWAGFPDEARAPWLQSFSFDNHPCESVDWWQAQAFCRWLSEHLGLPVVLPTERQWERAAAGGGRKARTYPWGNRWDSSRVNAESSLGQTSAVGIYPRGATKNKGVHDLSGNVWEWTADTHDGSKAADDASDVPRVFRGGSWGRTSGSCRTACRLHDLPGIRSYGLGFRVVCCPIQEP